MAKTGKPRGLIDYLTEDDATAEKAGGQPKSVLRSLLHVRTVVYFTLWCAIGAAMLFALGARDRIGIDVQQDRNPLYVQLSDGAVRNAFTVKLRNMQSRPRRMEVALSGLPGAKMWSEDLTRAAGSTSVSFTVPADSVLRARLFVASTAPAAHRQDFSFTVRALDKEGGTAHEYLHFEGPQP